jgi:hypothetical protein
MFMVVRAFSDRTTACFPFREAGFFLAKRGVERPVLYNLEEVIRQLWDRQTLSAKEFHEKGNSVERLGRKAADLLPDFPETVAGLPWSI